MTDEAMPIAAFDTETTSTRDDREVWEVGIVLRREGQPDHEQDWFLPVTLQEADRFSLSVGGFYERHPYGRYLSRRDMGCPPRFLPDTEAAAIESVRTWREIGRLLHGALIVGAVPSFDETAIAAPLRTANVLPAHDYHLCDVGTLAVGYLAGQGKPVPPPPWKSGDIAGWLGVAPTPEAERHTALGDARLAMRIWDFVTGGGA